MKTKSKINSEQFNEMLSSMSTKLQPIIEQKALSAVKNIAGGKISRKHSLFNRVNMPATQEHSFQFFKAILSGDLLGVKDLSAGTSSAGGYLVPTDFRDEIIARLPVSSELAPYVRTVPVRSDTGSIPSLATDIAVNWRGGTTPAENQLISTTDPVLSSVSWSLKRADALTKISRELVADSQPSIVEFVTGLFQEALSAERDKMIAIGDGNDQPEGISVATGLSTIAAVGSLTVDALISLEHTLARKYRMRARWVMNSKNLGRIFALTETTGKPIFMRDVVAGNPETMVLGYPVSIQDDLADDEIYFGDLSQYLWFDREEMGIESTHTGGDAFAQHQLWIKVFERADGKLGLKESFVKATGIID